MNLKVSFSWIGLVIFALPMLINIAYVMFPPVGKAEQTAAVTHWIEIVEQPHRLSVCSYAAREPGCVQLSERLALSCGCFPDFVLRRVVPLFYGWPRNLPAELFVPLCPDAAGGVSCAVLSVRRYLAA